MTEQLQNDKKRVEEAVVDLIVSKAKEPDEAFMLTLPELLDSLVRLWFAF